MNTAQGSVLAAALLIGLVAAPEVMAEDRPWHVGVGHYRTLDPYWGKSESSIYRGGVVSVGRQSSPHVIGRAGGHWMTSQQDDGQVVTAEAQMLTSTGARKDSVYGLVGLGWQGTLFVPDDDASSRWNALFLNYGAGMRFTRWSGEVMWGLPLAAGSTYTDARDSPTYPAPGPFRWRVQVFYHF